MVAYKASRASNENFHRKCKAQSTATGFSAAACTWFHFAAELRQKRDQNNVPFRREFDSIGCAGIQPRLFLQRFRQRNAPAILYTARRHVVYSSASGASPMFFSPAALRSL